ncbi:MAG TPA: hypothetical protein VHY84_12495 [Bryobacteraceae bacterium]|jgi:glucose dehydrogenase|nr:hypothetical protein [Bryobacteraceae bacterium]
MKPAATLWGLAVCLPVVGQTRIPGSDWPMYTRDHAGSRYSALNQINSRNVARPR